MALVQQLSEENYDVLVVGAGIGGMEAAVSLGDMGFRVLLVDREPSIGGHMYLLSKVFPTLDCASCISGTKMSTSSHHPNVTLLPYSDVKEIVKEGEGRFRAKVLEQPRYVDASLCTSCGQCEEACPIIVEKENDFGLRGRKAIYIPFDTAVPKKAVVDISSCIYCLQCERTCPAGAIDFLQTPKEHHLKVGAVVLAVGYDLFPAEKKAEYHYGEYENVVTSMQMDRLLGPTRPYNALVRNSDGKEPQNIAYALCTGSRDRSLGNPRCSQVCCMYSMKQAQLILGSLPAANVTLYYMDIRAYGKGFEEFYQQAKAMGVNFVRGKVAKIEQKENGDLEVYHEDTQGKGTLEKTTHDMVVLAVGLLPRPEIARAFTNQELKLDEAGWIQLADEDESAVRTTIDGVFAAGCATGPKDIPDSALEAAASASECAAYLTRVRRKEGAG
ncbi:MAG: CoB--CoM heterodisulfide reductase iron-sulfur subunit A family protein [Nitrososphaerota archaeon]|nr:CoB--CoM heterodisulfide reductase iron-sulfur subunit A family protein [Nitrososphaerota archaeon]MDG7023810.1 CoB--CoM heterodisulfide reductase iron-sulfur subunit A family protein [Nitrososphaerota archaeon]